MTNSTQLSDSMATERKMRNVDVPSGFVAAAPPSVEFAIMTPDGSLEPAALDVPDAAVTHTCQTIQSILPCVA